MKIGAFSTFSQLHFQCCSVPECTIIENGGLPWSQQWICISWVWNSWLNNKFLFSSINAKLVPLNGLTCAIILGTYTFILITSYVLFTSIKGLCGFATISTGFKRSQQKCSRVVWDILVLCQAVLSKCLSTLTKNSIFFPLEGLPWQYRYCHCFVQLNCWFNISVGNSPC